MQEKPEQPGEGQRGGQSAIAIESTHKQLVDAIGHDLSQNIQLLVGNFVDDSSSIRTYRNVDAVIQGHNQHVNGLPKSTGNIFVMTRYLNGEKLFDYRPPEKAIMMNADNYDPRHGTPLYKQTPIFLRDEVLSEYERRGGVQSNVFTFNTLFSDGENTEATEFGPDDSRRIIEPMFESRRHIVAALGVEGAVDLYQIFRSMGIPEQWIKILERRDIAQSMGTMSDFATSASQSVDDFTSASVTGFRVPPKKKT